MKNVKTFALIENCSGFVWFVGQAESAVAACVAADLDTGNDTGTYEEVYGLASNESGYHVYAAPAGFSVNDGQDRAAIEAVNALPFIGKFKSM